MMGQGIISCNFLFAPMNAEFPVLIPFLAHQEGEQVVIHIKPVIDFIQVHTLS